MEEEGDDHIIYTFAPAEIIFPGMGDLHVHAREDVSQKLCAVEDFTSIGRAALKGGVCFIGEMPNNPCPPLDATTYLAKLALANKAALPVFLYAALTDTSNPLPWPVPYKAFLTAPDPKNALTKKNLGVYQQGNFVRFEAYARLEENMWNLRVELLHASAVNFLTNPQKLAALSAFCALCCETMPEGQDLEEFYIYADNFIKQIHEDNWLTYYCRFEFSLLSFLGISLACISLRELLASLASFTVASASLTTCLASSAFLVTSETTLVRFLCLSLSISYINITSS